MAYTKDYYHVLNLPGTTPTAAELRRAYRIALLGAHPDKWVQGGGEGEGDGGGGDGGKKEGVGMKGTGEGKGKEGGGGYTVDDIKEAYGILTDVKRKAEYDTWVLQHASQTFAHGRVEGGAGAADRDFILGLEVLDLGDFAVSDVEEGDGEREGQTQWSRGCRCGDERGFRILESELEGAEARGEKEVLVGCEGCSLWVRVGFDVEEEEGVCV